MAKLHNPDRAQIDVSKITDYLLSRSHPRGAAKAEFFGQFGFSDERPDEFRRAVIEHALANDVLTTRISEFGVIIEVAGPVAAPDGRNPLIMVV